MKDNQLHISKKINVLILVNELFINNFVSLYESIQNNSFFSVTVVTCASLSTDYKEEISSDMVFNYLRKNNIDCINGFDYFNNCYIDLVQFNPDYIFVITPYDIYRPQEYSSANLSKIAKLCTIEYGAVIINNIENELINNRFYNNCYFNFINSEKELDNPNIINDSNFQKIANKFIPIGCIKLDKYLFQKKEDRYWKTLFDGKDLNKLRIVWKPRWTIEHENDFFQTLKEFVDYCKINKNKVELLLLEHPLLRSKLKSIKLLKKYEKIIKKVPTNFYIYDKSDFLDYVLEADVLVGENTSLMAEFSVTNNPIIYVGDYSILNGLGRSLILKENTVKNFDQIKKILDNLEHKIIEKYQNTKLFNSNNKSSSDYLLDVLKEDYEKNNNYYRDYLLKYSNEINKIKQILIQGYYEDILDKEIEDFEVISNSLKIWNDEITRLKK